MLTKQQKLDVLSKAIDEGAKIRISFHGLTRSNAALKTKTLAEMLGTSVKNDNNLNTYWYQAESPELRVTAFYDNKSPYMVEDVARTIEEEVY